MPLNYLVLSVGRHNGRHNAWSIKWMRPILVTVCRCFRRFENLHFVQNQLFADFWHEINSNLR